MEMESLVTARTFEEQEVVFLALELCNVLETILQQQGWNPTHYQLALLEKAVVDYVVKYREAIVNSSGEWNVVLGNYILKRVQEKRGRIAAPNSTKKKIDQARNSLFKKLKNIGVMDLIRESPVFSIIITSYREKENEIEKTTLTRTNTVKYSYGYGSDHKKVFKEVIPV